MQSIESIIYWKWDDDTLDHDAIRRKVDDLTARCGINAVIVSTHWAHRSFDDPEHLAAIETCCHALHERGRKLFLEVCPRNEGAHFFQRYPKDVAYLVSFEELSLDENGRGECEIAAEPTYHYWRSAAPNGPEVVVNAWCFDRWEDRLFDPTSLQRITHLARIEHSKDDRASGARFIVAGDTSSAGGEGVIARLVIDAGPENAGKTAFACLGTPQPIPDLFSPHLYDLYAHMLGSVKYIPLDGVCSDEWGYDVILKISEPNPYDDTRLSMRHLSYSNAMSADYQRRYGVPLEDDLLLTRFAPAGEAGKRIAAINRYVACFRAKMAENDERMYVMAKETFGPDTFFGVHPTWWGSPDSLNFEVFKNGFYWWEARRDYAQTDELVILPIRTALAHKWRSPVWYNMWYSMGTRDIRTYFKETWRNVRFGGRTDYHGYECPNEPVVLALYQAGMLEQIEEMDSQVRILDRVQASQPDCRVLVLFGMEAVTNWELSGRALPPWCPQNPVLDGVLNTAAGLFEEFLCDLVPTSEIVNGSLQINASGKPVYGSQEYDAVLLLSPESMDRGCYRFLEQLTGCRDRFAVAGYASCFSDGAPIGRGEQTLLDRAARRWDNVPPVGEIVALLAGWEVKRKRSRDGCVLQDGAVIYTAEGEKPSDNPLAVYEVIEGHAIAYEGSDFLYVDWSPGPPRGIYPAGGTLFVDGQEVINSNKVEKVG